MLSLPLIPPSGDMWHRSDHLPRPESPPPSNGTAQPQTHRQRQQRDEDRKQFNARSPLALLAAEEAAIAQRKAAVRNFGAYWIRPPGVAKTLQAMTEEEAERLEQAEIERQEMGLADMRAQQQQLEEARQRADEAAVRGDGEEERNLDDDIPEAEATTEEVTFNEESMVEGSQVEAEAEGDTVEEDGGHWADLEAAELTGIVDDELELGIEHEPEERDLDDSVPEAGSYQHTDTEEEDSDSESDLSNSFAGQNLRRSAATPMDRPMTNQSVAGGLHARMRSQVGVGDALPRSPGSLNLSSSLLESSLTSSSPVQRANQVGRGRGGAGRRGRLS